MMTTCVHMNAKDYNTRVTGRTLNGSDSVTLSVEIQDKQSAGIAGDVTMFFSGVKQLESFIDQLQQIAQELDPDYRTCPTCTEKDLGGIPS